MQSLRLCVLALAVAVGSAYIVGNEYTYETEGKILHEFAKKLHQHAGYYFKSNLIAQTVKKDMAIFKIDNMLASVVNTRVDPSKKDIDYKPSPEETTVHLSKPFEVRYEHGLVVELKVAKDDPIWSVNIKKSIAARLQMNFDRVNQIHEGTHKNESHFDNKYYYKTMEEGIRGECGVEYIIDDSHDNEIHVTKTTDFMHCKAHTYRWYSNRNTDACYECGNHINSPMQLSEISHFHLKGDRNNHVMEKLHAEEMFAYAPHGMDEAEYIVGDAQIDLKLIDDKPIQSQLQLPADAVTHHDLHFHFEEPQEINTVDDLKKTPHHIWSFADPKTPPEAALKIMDSITSVHDDELYTEIYKDKDMPILFMQLANAMNSLTYDEIEQIYTTHIQQAKETGERARHKRILFMNALLNAGTSASFMFIKHIVTEINIPTHIKMYILGQLPTNIKQFSPILIEEFYTMCEHPKVHDNMFTRKICYLAFSKFVHEQCVAKYHKIYEVYHTTEKILCTPETAEKYFKKMVKDHEGHAKDSLERTLCIKTAGNFGTKESLHYLMKIVDDTSLPTYFRFTAISSLDHHTGFYSEEVLSLMWPIYFNVSEPHELRMAALINIMQSDPELHHLEAIADSVASEFDHQVAHFAMSVIKSCSKSESPCYRKLSGMCKRVRRNLKRADFKVSHDLRHSTVWFSDGYDKEFKLGGNTWLAYILSDKSYVPQHLSLGMEDYKGLILENPFEVGYVGYGLDKVFDRVIGLLKQKKSLLNLFRRKTRDTNIAEKELKEIDDKLHIDTRTPEPILADIYIDAFGSEINFFHFNDSTIQSVIKHGANYLGEILNTLKDVSKYTTKNFFTGRQFKFIMPSMLGIPMYVDVSEAHFLYYRNNNFKFNVNPNPLAEGTDENAPTTINLKIDGHMVHESATFVGAGILLPRMDIATGAGVVKTIYKSIPLKLKMAAEPNIPKVVLKLTPITPHTLLRKQFIPFTMLINMKDPAGDLSKSLLPYTRPDEMKKVEMDLFHDFLGHGIHFKANVGELHKLRSLGSFGKFMAETDLREKIYYLSENPLAAAYGYEMSLTPASKDQTSEIDVELHFDHFGYHTNSDKVYKPDFPTVEDGFENYINSRGDRKPSTCVLKVERVAKGSKERTISAELAYTHTFDNLYHRFDLSYDRSPFGPNEKEHLKFCSSNSIMFPHVDMKKLYELDTVNMDPRIKVATDHRFGKNCENDKKIKIRGDMSRTEEHKQMQANRDKPEENCPYRNADAYLYNKCKQDIANDYHYGMNCRKYWYRSLKLRHYSLDIELENLDEKDRVALRKLDNCVKNMFFYYFHDEANAVPNDTNKVHVEADFSARSNHVDVEVRKPLETTKFDHVPHPDWIQARSATPFFEFTNKIKRWGFFRKPYCYVEGNNMRTFDDLLYELPPIDCEKVIAKDCSHKEIFTVLGKHIKHNRYDKAVKVFIKKYKIEALPVSEDSEIIVRLNGQAIPVTEAEPYFQYENIKGKDILVFSVSFNGIQYKIKSEYYGVTVYYGGTAIVVTLNPYYRGKQCGLCGNFDHDDFNDFVGPRNCVYQNATDFAYSYAIPDAGCHVPDLSNVPCEPLN